VPDYETLSPYLLLRTLPELASNRVPEGVRAACGDTPLEAWQLLEEGVFFFFRQVLMLHTIRLGGNCLFEREPEGIVLVNREHNPFAFIYECKARGNGYRLSSDDTLRYREYTKKKRQEIRAKYNLPLTHFLIVSSSFSGDIEERVDEIGFDGTVLCLVPAIHVTVISDRLKTLPFPEIQLLQLHRLFRRGVLAEQRITSCLGGCP
jgi:hypothetical protein